MGRLLLPLVAVCCAWAQDGEAPTVANAESAKVLNVFIGRVGFFGGVNYGYTEWFEARDTRHPKWSLLGPDVGAIFFGDIGRYREFFLGAGFEVRPTMALTIDHEIEFDQATGPDGHSKTWYTPWTRVAYQFPGQWASELVFFPYFPLNGGTTQLVIERSRLWYGGFRHFNIGGGYAAYQDFTRTNWENKPFAMLTWKSQSFGHVEMWFQVLPDAGFQFQVRHLLTWHSRY
jgi:hypothetical protein